MNDAPITLREQQEQAQLGLHEAFDEMVKEVEENSGSPRLQPQEETTSEQDSLATDLDDDTDVSVESSSQEEITQEKPKRGRPSKQQESSETDLSAKNYEEEYNKLKQESEAQLGLVNSRLQALSAQYQELKNSTPAKEQEEQEVVPDNIKEAFDIFPDLREAVHFMINSEVKKVRDQLQPLQEFSAEEKKNRIIATIKAAHPDVEDIVGSGELTVWANSLSPVMKSGAFAVINSGSPEEVIDLLTQYKQANNMGSGESNLPTAPANAEQGTDATMVNKVLSALSVPSNKEPVNLNTNPTKKEKTFDDAVRELEEQRKRNLGW